MSGVFVTFCINETWSWFMHHSIEIKVTKKHMYNLVKNQAMAVQLI